MNNNGAWTSNNLKAGQGVPIPKGYHNGEGTVYAASLASQTSANASAGHILKGETAWVNGSKVTGTMENRGAWSDTIKVPNNGKWKITIPEGYHNGSGEVYVYAGAY